MSEPLHTLVGTCRHTEEIRKSRFLAQAAPVDSAGQALAFVSAASDPTATHNCWAYRIGQDYRFNDDGEPGGTAGRPILQAIEGQGMDRVVVLVTRWFGGTNSARAGWCALTAAPPPSACAAQSAYRSWRWRGSACIAISPRWPCSRPG